MTTPRQIVALVILVVLIVVVAVSAPRIGRGFEAASGNGDNHAIAGETKAERHQRKAERHLRRHGESGGEAPKRARSGRHKRSHDPPHTEAQQRLFDELRHELIRTAHLLEARLDPPVVRRCGVAASG